MSVISIISNSINLNCSILGQTKFTNRILSTTAEESKLPATSHEDDPVDMINPFQKEKTKCILCKNEIEPNYKNVQFLSQFQSPYTGRIYGRHITGLCRIMQERVEKEIARAQFIGLMGSWTKKPEFLKDPKLFDPERPIRNHKY